jgi:nitrogen fixation NifU-like protein
MEDPLYREIILEHWQNPQNYGVVKNPSFDITDNNPTCGDKIRITGKIQSGKLIDIKFTLRGCAISKASASLFTEKIKGLSYKDILKINEKKVLKNLPVEITPARHNCALLPYHALQKEIKGK